MTDRDRIARAFNLDPAEVARWPEESGGETSGYCPVCEGTGRRRTRPNGVYVLRCPACKGTGLIHKEVTP